MKHVFPTSLIRAVGGGSTGGAATAAHWLTHKTESMTLPPPSALLRGKATIS